MKTNARSLGTTKDQYRGQHARLLLASYGKDKGTKLTVRALPWGELTTASSERTTPVQRPTRVSQWEWEVGRLRPERTASPSQPLLGIYIDSDFGGWKWFEILFSGHSSIICVKFFIWGPSSLADRSPITENFGLKVFMRVW